MWRGQLCHLLIVTFITVLIFPKISFINSSSFALDYYYHGYLKWSDSPVAKGMGGCEINLTDRYASLTNPAALGIFHLNKRISVSFPNNYELGSEDSTDLELKSQSVSIGYPITIGSFTFGFGIGYSRKNSRSYKARLPYINPPITQRHTYTEEAECYSVGISIVQNARLALGYTLKQVDSWYNIPFTHVEKYNEDYYKVHDIGFYFDFPLSESENLKHILQKIDTGDIKHDIVPSLAFVRSNIGSKLLYPYQSFDNRILAEVDKIGLSLLFISRYKDAEMFSLRISHEFKTTHAVRGFDYGRTGFEIGAGGTLYIRAGFWSTDAFEGDIWTYGVGFNLGGLANILYAAGKIDTVNPLARFVLRNINISADFAMERSDDRSEYDNEEYFKISLSL